MEKEEDKKYTLRELVKNSSETDTLITGALANAHLLTEYYKELKQKQLGLEIKEKISKKEFEKIIEKYKRKEV